MVIDMLILVGLVLVAGWFAGNIQLFLIDRRVRAASDQVE